MGLWIKGARVRTLPAAIAPVVVGASAAALSLESLRVCDASAPQSDACVANTAQYDLLLSRFWPVAVLCALVALLMQIAANYANDYSDGIRGTDEGRGEDETAMSGPQRLVASGLVPASQVLAASGVAVVLACLAGIVAAAVSGHWWLIALGVLCLPAGWYYTGGRRPYGYAGWGEAFVFVFFGLVATLGTQYAIAGVIDRVGVLAAVSVGLNAVALLMVNNLRDVDADRAHGKRTLAVRMGARRCRTLLIAVVVVSWLIAAVLVTLLWAPWGMLLLLSGMAVPIRMIRSTGKGDFRSALMDAGFVILFFAALFALSSAVTLGGLSSSGAESMAMPSYGSQDGVQSHDERGADRSPAPGELPFAGRIVDDTPRSA